MRKVIDSIFGRDPLPVFSTTLSGFAALQRSRRNVSVRDGRHELPTLLLSPSTEFNGYAVRDIVEDRLGVGKASARCVSRYVVGLTVRVVWATTYVWVGAEAAMNACLASRFH